MPIPNKPSYVHGSTGTEPGSALDYVNGDSLDSENLDYYLYTEFEKLSEIIDALNELQSGVIKAGIATDAENVTGTYKGNDIDSNGDGRVDDADSAQRVKGNDIDSDGDGQVDAADHADTAGDAETVDGSNIYVQSATPSSPSTGDIWIEL